MRILLDTNAYVELKRGHEGVAELVRESERIIISTIVAGELIYGFRAGSQLGRNLKELNLFLDNPYVRIAPVTMVTADRFGRIASGLRQKGRPIPTNDVWIAAQVMETATDLVSFDKHFGYVDGLVWVDPSS